MKDTVENKEKVWVKDVYKSPIFQGNLMFFSVCSHFNTFKKKTFRKHCGKR